MLDGDLTHVSTVQTWECDSNAHLNVQFFHQRFREAGYLFRQRNGLAGTAMASAHTRFYRELHVDDTATVFTLPVRDAHGAVFLMHRLTVDGDTLCCCSLDRLDGDTSRLAPLPLSDFPQVAPRGLPEGPTPPVEGTDALIAAGAAAVTCITHVLPSDMDHAGVWRAERLISSFSNGGQSAWALVGAVTPWLREHNLGRVVLEMKLDCFTPPAAGAVLRQTSHCIELGAKTYRFGHQIEDAVTGRLYAAGQVLSILMDHGSRKAVPIPPDLKAPAAP
ncbi:thioesterase family protein [Antarcticimicrobium luteum]|nr:thioesterase family protein [Antarcticimicrobium luteum]